MTKVEIYKDNKGNIIRYKISGHAGFAEKGEDVVCAAVSALSQTALVSLVEVIGISEKELEFYIDEKKGILDVQLPKLIGEITNKEAQILLKTFEIGIKKIVESYSEYVTLKYREV
ncbi:MAG: ribosomal-processing cysteine protease Prp [Tissierellia bacterium]|nr:ribosomal-processing cysteine protease Prp [Tissierellia bacterium]